MPSEPTPSSLVTMIRRVDSAGAVVVLSSPAVLDGPASDDALVESPSLEQPASAAAPSATAARVGASGRRAGRVRQRTQDVEERRNPHLPTRFSSVSQCGVEHRCEAERDAQFLQAGTHRLGGQVHDNTERGQHIS